MFRWVRLVLMMLAVAATLHGCYTSVSLAPNARIAPGVETGIVFGSIGVSSTAPTIDFSSLQFRPAGYHEQRTSEFLFHSPVGVMGAVLSPMFITPVEFDEPEGKGTLFVATLPVGDYLMVSAAIANAPFAGFGAHVYTPDAGGVPFHVEGGRATYLGQFLSHLHMGRDRFGIPVVQGAYFVASDRLQRDLSLLAKRGMHMEPGLVLNLAPRFTTLDNPAFRPSPR